MQSFGVLLVNIVIGEEDEITYLPTFQPGLQRSVEETLRVVTASAVKEMDEAKRNLFTGAEGHIFGADACRLLPACAAWRLSNRQVVDCLHSNFENFYPGFEVTAAPVEGR